MKSVLVLKTNLDITPHQSRLARQLPLKGKPISGRIYGGRAILHVLNCSVGFQPASNRGLQLQSKLPNYQVVMII